MHNFFLQSLLFAAQNTQRDAEALGNRMLEAGFLRHVTSHHRFKNEYLFYEFLDDFIDLNINDDERKATDTEVDAGDMEELEPMRQDQEQQAVEDLSNWIVQRKQEDETLEILLGTGFIWDSVSQSVSLY